MGLRRDVDALGSVLDGVIVGDDLSVLEAEEVVKESPLGPRQPGGFAVIGGDGEAAIVLGEVAMEHLLRLGGGAGVGQPEFAGESVLKGPPEPFHPAFGLGRAGEDQLYAELLE